MKVFIWLKQYQETVVVADNIEEARILAIAAYKRWAVENDEPVSTWVEDNIQNEQPDETLKDLQAVSWNYEN